MSEYRIYSVNGPVVKVVGGKGLAMMDMVFAGDQQLIGEVVGVEGDMTTVQVYEDTAGLAPGQPVTTTGSPMALMLGPGLLGQLHGAVGTAGVHHNDLLHQALDGFQAPGQKGLLVFHNHAQADSDQWAPPCPLEMM